MTTIPEADVSRKGSVSLPIAKITHAELDTIDAEVKNQEKKTDIPSIVISALSASALVVNILQTQNWQDRTGSVVVLFVGVGMFSVQLYRAVSSWCKPKSQHQKNAERYIQDLREVISSGTK